METKKSMECILKDPMGKTIPVVPRLISVNPLNIIIEPSTGQIDKSLELKNVYPCRVAFRIRTNGPTRYTVCPNKGFLSIGEKTMILISMIEGSKYQSNHQFIVQAMAAPGDFSDRKLIWKQPNPLGFLTNTRVKTMRPGQSLNSPCSKSPMVLSTPNDSCINSTARSESLATGSTSSLTKPADNGVFADNINNLSSQVKKAIAEKNARASEMVAVVNEIKAIEVELDRQAQVVNELSERVKKGELQYSNLVMLERNLRTELDRYKNNDGGEPSGF